MIADHGAGKSVQGIIIHNVFFHAHEKSIIIQNVFFMRMKNIMNDDTLYRLDAQRERSLMHRALISNCARF